MKYMLEQDTDNSGTLDFEEFKVVFHFIFNFKSKYFSLYRKFEIKKIPAGGDQDRTEETARFVKLGLIALTQQQSILCSNVNQVRALKSMVKPNEILIFTQPAPQCHKSHAGLLLQQIRQELSYDGAQSSIKFGVSSQRNSCHFFGS